MGFHTKARRRPPNSSPRFRGEGDRVKPGGGEMLTRRLRGSRRVLAPPIFPSTRLRLVPLPVASRQGGMRGFTRSREGREEAEVRALIPPRHLPGRGTSRSLGEGWWRGNSDSE